MWQLTIDTVSTFGVGMLCLTLCIMVLTLFFKGLSWLSNVGVKPDAVSIRGVLGSDTWVTVHMTPDEVFKGVRFVGFTNLESLKNQFPGELYGMVVLEDRNAQRFLVRAKAIRMIEIENTSKD